MVAFSKTLKSEWIRTCGALLLLLVVATNWQMRQQYLDRSLILAIEQGDVREVVRLLDLGANANAEQSYELQELSQVQIRKMAPWAENTHHYIPSALYVALGYGRNTQEQMRWTQWQAKVPAMVKALLEHGANVEERLLNGESPFITAGHFRTPEVMEVLRTHGANVHAVTKEGDNALFWWDTSPANLQYLLKCGLDVNAHDVAEQTPLITIAFSGDVEQLQVLVRYGANVNVASKLGYTPLMRAVIAGKSDKVTYLIAHGANVHVKK